MSNSTPRLPWCLLIIAVACTALSWRDCGATEIVVHPPAAPGPLDNPLKGWAVYPHEGAIFQPYSMVQFYVSWKELEPADGDYRFAEWERRVWANPLCDGKRVIFRIYVDYPSLPSGTPDWLVEKGVKITPHDCRVGSLSGQGRGYSPDYDNPEFVRAAERLIAALGKRYDQNTQVAFIIAGILGFWGEWHTFPRTELFASDATQKRIIDAYHKAFPTKKVMVRYPQGYAGRQPWLGFHDDSFPDDTDGQSGWEFLAKMRGSGRIENWKVAPIGGEMVPEEARRCLGSDWKKTLRMLKDAHFSWIGPYSPAREEPAPEFSKRCQMMVRNMGYEYRLTEVRHQPRVRFGKCLAVSLKGVNQGVAPFYYPWAVELALIDSHGNAIQIRRVNTDIRKWLPGPFQLKDQFRVSAPKGDYSLAIGVRDPWTDKPGIAFANSIPKHAGWNVISRIVVAK